MPAITGPSIITLTGFTFGAENNSRIEATAWFLDRADCRPEQNRDDNGFDVRVPDGCFLGGLNEDRNKGDKQAPPLPG
jgi:hypothetical protein